MTTEATRSLPSPFRLRQKRVKMKLSQKEVADLMRVTQVTLSNWERGVHVPHDFLLELWRDTLEGYKPPKKKWVRR